MLQDSAFALKGHPVKILICSSLLLVLLLHVLSYKLSNQTDQNTFCDQTLILNLTA